MNTLRLELNNHLDLNKTFNCGQTFRWHRSISDPDAFEGCVHGHGIRVKIETGILVIEGQNLRQESFYRHYFDLDTPYDEICNRLSEKDEVMERAVADGKGIFLLRQEPWEMLVTFILSANNNIPRITNSIAALCNDHGSGCFPQPETLASMECPMLRCLGFGYRDKYVIDTSKHIVNEKIDLESWGGLSTEELRKRLMGFPGVGRKVADCILLFAYGRHEVFPVDTWIRKAILRYYPHETDASPEGIEEFVGAYFGEEAGFAQQLLFHHIRQSDGR